MTLLEAQFEAFKVQVKGEVGGVDVKLDGVKWRVDGVEGQLGAVKGRVDGVEGQLDGVKAKVWELERRVNLILDGVAEGLLTPMTVAEGLLTPMTVAENTEAMQQGLNTLATKLSKLRDEVATSDRSVRRLDLLTIGSRKILESIISYKLKDNSNVPLFTRTSNLKFPFQYYLDAQASLVSLNNLS